MLKKFGKVTALLFMMTFVFAPISFVGSQKPAQAWPWTKTVYLKGKLDRGYALVGFQYVEIRNRSGFYSKVKTNWLGHYSCSVPVNEDYTVTGTLTTRQTRTATVRVNKPSGIAYDVICNIKY